MPFVKGQGGFSSGTGWCCICGLPVNEKTSKWLHMTTGGKYVSRDYTGNDSQGCFPIGPDCLKKQTPEIQQLAFKWPKEWAVQPGGKNA